MRCPHCNTELAASSVYCHECGAGPFTLEPPQAVESPVAHGAPSDQPTNYVGASQAYQGAASAQTPASPRRKNGLLVFVSALVALMLVFPICMAFSTFLEPPRSGSSTSQGTSGAVSPGDASKPTIPLLSGDSPFASSSAEFAAKHIPSSSNLSKFVQSYEPGQVVGKEYRNESLSLAFGLPDGWSFASDADVAELNDGNTAIDADSVSYSAEMLAIDNDASSYFLWSAGVSESSKKNLKSELRNSFVAISESDKDDYVKSLSARAGISNITVELSETTIGGEATPCLHASYLQDGEMYYEGQIIYGKGDTLVGLSVASRGTDRVYEIFANLKPLAS